MKKVLFSVTRRTANVFLVLQVHKVLQGDVDLSVEPYTKISVGIEILLYFSLDYSYFFIIASYQTKGP